MDEDKPCPSLFDDYTFRKRNFEDFIRETRKPKFRVDLSKLYFREPYDHSLSIKVMVDFGLPLDSMVHASHCTSEHGCKYGDYDCPVELGLVKPIFTAEQLDF